MTDRLRSPNLRRVLMVVGIIVALLLLYSGGYVWLRCEYYVVHSCTCLPDKTGRYVRADSVAQGSWLWDGQTMQFICFRFYAPAAWLEGRVWRLMPDSFSTIRGQDSPLNH